MTSHFKRTLAVIVAIVVGLSGLFVYLKHKYDSVFPSTIHLPANIKERVSFNEKTHTLTVTTATKTVKEYAKNPDVSITKTGDVIINRHLIGFENSLFLGVGYADCGRLFIGDNVFHFGRSDFGIGLGIAPDSTRIIIKSYLTGSYIVYSNVSLGLGLSPFSFGNVPSVAGFVSLKI